MPFKPVNEKLIPLVWISVSLALFTPVLGITLSLTSAVWIHAISYMVLGIFFEVPELSLNLCCLWLACREETLERRLTFFPGILRVRYILTHVVGPSSGIMVLTSGLYLMHKGGHSLREAWIFWILLVSVIGLYKGLIQHNFFVKTLLLKVQSREASPRALRRMIRSPFDHSLIFLEFPTYVFTYTVALIKPVWPNPFGGLVNFLEGIVQPPVLVGVGLIAAGGLLVIPLRFCMVRWSRVRQTESGQT